MKYQACAYQLTQASPWRNGLAKMDPAGFNQGGVEFIIDAETGDKAQGNVWNYRLCIDPLSYIDVNTAY